MKTYTSDEVVRIIRELDEKKPKLRMKYPHLKKIERP